MIFLMKLCCGVIMIALAILIVLFITGVTLEMIDEIKEYFG